jgi:hypothetical protein
MEFDLSIKGFIEFVTLGLLPGGQSPQWISISVLIIGFVIWYNLRIKNNNRGNMGGGNRYNG